MMRLVDVFAGCGGLSLGFDLCDGQIEFETSLAIDNEPSATRLFNANFRRLRGARAARGAETARTVDVCWFLNSDEIRLFYLSHIAKMESDQGLRAKLLRLGFGKALSAIQRLDMDCEVELQAVGRSPGYTSAASKVEPATYNLASVKKLLQALGVRSFNRPGPDGRYLPWSEESTDGFWNGGQVGDDLPINNQVYGANLWRNATHGIRAGAARTGRGQHAGNASRYETLTALLDGPWGKRLEEIILEWRSQRMTAIQKFVADASSEIETIYLRDYRVAGLLGGPPCKGFSRIARPIANSLREQGVFAWANDEFGDERNKLVLHYVMFLEALRPAFFLFENVSNFQSSLRTPDGDLQADQVFAGAVANLSAGRLS